MTLPELRQVLSDSQTIQDRPFEVLKAVTSVVSADSGSDDAHELVLRALDQRESFGKYVPALDSLVRAVGLYPYAETGDISSRDALEFEFNRPLHMDEFDVVFHKEQADVYRLLLDGYSVVLSAPTSFGKSLVIDAIIATERFANVAVIVPTIALIDETRTRLSRFKGKYKIITHPAQQPGARNVYVLTQERILDLPHLESIEFFAIDEFYKLSPRQDKDRSLLLNQAFYRLLKSGKQFYLLGPNIKRIPDEFPKELRVRFVKTDYSTVVSVPHRVEIGDGGKTDEERLVGLCGTLKDSTLIFCKSPGSARDVARALVDGKVSDGDDDLRDMGDWIAGEYHPDWLMVQALRRGIGVHHGKIPRALAQWVVRAFNEGKLKFLVCTSTLIEGVNTRAKNVVIFDNQIARRKFDYFTFSNIRGRSGRMFHHFVGHVYLFHEPPEPDFLDVDIPFLTQPEGTETSLLIQMDSADLTERSRQRLAPYLGQTDLELETLRNNVGIPPEDQLRVAVELMKNPRVHHDYLGWAQFPTAEELRRTCELMWDTLGAKRCAGSGAVTAKQLSFQVNRFRVLKTVSELVRASVQVANPDWRKAPDEAVEDAVEFMRVWANHHFPRYLVALNRIQRDVFSRLGMRPGEFSFFAHQVENWFLPAPIMALDEYGLPVQIGAKLSASLPVDAGLDAVLVALRSLKLDGLGLSSFETSVVKSVQLAI